VKSTWFATGQVVLGAALWGTWSLFLRPAHLPSQLSAPIALVMMGFFSIPLVMQDKITPAWNSNTIRWFILLSVGDAVNMAAFFGAMSKTTVAVAVLTHYFAPILVALFAPLVDKLSRSLGALVVRRCLLSSGSRLVLEPWDPEAYFWGRAGRCAPRHA
jgi:DME family drug/metabolite transporter